MNLLGILLSVLLVGHSLFGQKSPPMLEQLLLAQGADQQVVAQIINGAPLRYNWENGATAQGVNARDHLAQGNVDVVILTEAQPLAEHVKWSDTSGHALNYYQLATRANARAQVYLQETWPAGVGSLDWRGNLDAQLALWQGIVSEVNTNRDAASPAMRLIPAGQAMAHLNDAIARGEVPGLVSITALFDDDIHLNDLGHYYVALVQYAVLTGQNPEGLPHRLNDPWGKPYSAPSADLAGHLQRVAWAVVTSSGATRAAAIATEAKPDIVPSPMGIGLAEIADWSTQQPFLDVMKTARPWILHKRGQWGGGDYRELALAGHLDAYGWPKRLPRDLGTVGTVILSDMPAEAASLAGRYHLSFDGTGIVEISGRASNVRYGKGEVTFDYTPGPGVVEIRLQRSDPARNGDYIRNIRVVKAAHIDRLRVGEIFNPDWLERIDGFEVLRFMDWMATNNATLSQWQDRPLPQDYTYALKGVPLEVLLALVRQTGVDPWFTLPHLADDDYVHRFATMAQGGIAPGQSVYVEFSNEVWNWQFEQAKWADDAARARWDAESAGAQYHGMRAAQMAQIFSDVFDAEDAGPELVNVIATQTGWLGLEDSILNAPLWLAETGIDQPPAIYFDAYAVTGYFGGILGIENRAALVRGWIDESRDAAQQAGQAQGLSGATLDDYMTAHRFDLATQRAGEELRAGALSGDPADTMADLLGRVLPYHAQAAAKERLELVMYEGGSHVVGLGPIVDDPDLTAFFTAFNYSPEMGALYTDLIAGWKKLGGGTFAAYADVQNPTKWGSWGTLRYLSDNNPRWQALTCGGDCD